MIGAAILPGLIGTVILIATIIVVSILVQKSRSSSPDSTPPRGSAQESAAPSSPISSPSQGENPYTQGQDTSSHGQGVSCHGQDSLAHDASSCSASASAFSPNHRSDGEFVSGSSSSSSINVDEDGRADQVSNIAHKDGRADQAKEGSDENEQVAPAAQSLDAFALDATLRESRVEYWLDQWMLGTDACRNLNDALTSAHAVATACLAHTTIEKDGSATFPAGCERLNRVIDQVDAQAVPLRQLRALMAGQAVTGGKAGSLGLRQLVSKVEDELGKARLQIARLSPVAGSKTSAYLRAGFAEALSALRTASKLLDEVEQHPHRAANARELPLNETAAQAHDATADADNVLDETTLNEVEQHVLADPAVLGKIEQAIMKAVWWWRAIDATEAYFTRRDWAEVLDDAEEWESLARTSLELTQTLFDLEYSSFTLGHPNATLEVSAGEKSEAEAEHRLRIVELAGLQVLKLDPSFETETSARSADEETSRLRLNQRIVSICNTLITALQ